MSRDDFLAKTKMDLARRAGFRCSICQAPTSGPAENPSDTINLGEAGHIAGAAKGAKRFNPLMTSEERRAISNGIWLCRNCHGRIDRDESEFTQEKLFGFKKSAESKASLELGLPPISVSRNELVSVVVAQQKFEEKDFAAAKKYFGKIHESGTGDDLCDLMYIISGLSEKHASKLKLSEVNGFYCMLERIPKVEYRALATLLWLIIYYEFSVSKSDSRCRDEAAPENLNNFLVHGHSLNENQRELTKNIIFYSDEVKCLLS